MNVILLGYRGSGKTTLGHKLAAQLWKDFVDGDQEVRKHFDGRTIANIWETDGEPAFREAEAKITAELCALKDHVVSLGGGALMHPDALQAIKDAPDAKRIYLECDAEELHRRLQADATTEEARPDLTAAGGGLDEIQQVLAKRDPVYREAADHVFNVTHTNPDETAKFIVENFL